MNTTVDTWVVVPCFNEAIRLCPAAFLDAVSDNTSLGFVFVDDGSFDRTAGILRRLCGRSDQLVWTSLSKNLGKGEAVRRGIVEALRSTSARWVGYWDADLATPLTEIAAFQAVLERRSDIDVVMGVRLALCGHDVRHPSVRRLLSRVSAGILSVVLGGRVRDTQCGAKLFRLTPRFRQAVESPFVSRWLFDLELLLRCCTEPAASTGVTGRIYELPLESWTSQDQSKLRPWSYAIAAVDVIRIWRRTGATMGVQRWVDHHG